MSMTDDLRGLAAYDQARIPDDVDRHADDAIAIVRDGQCDEHAELRRQLREMAARMQAEAEAWRLRGEPAERRVAELEAELARLQAIEKAARAVLVAHSLPQYGARELDAALEQLVSALRVSA